MVKRFFNFSVFVYLAVIAVAAIAWLSGNAGRHILYGIAILAVTGLLNRLPEVREEYERDTLLRIAHKLTTVSHTRDIAIAISHIIDKARGLNTTVTDNTIIQILVVCHKEQDIAILGCALDLAILWDDGWGWFTPDYVDMNTLLKTVLNRKNALEKTAGGHDLLKRVISDGYKTHALQT